MIDLIDRQDAIDALDSGAELLRRVLDITDIIGAEREKYKWGLELIESCISDMKGLPSAEPKRGKWIRHAEIKNIYGGICIECSECGEKYVVQHIEDERFCRNCGADMRGEE